MNIVDEISKRAFEETRMGNIHDKRIKNQLAIECTPGVEDITYSIKALTGDTGLTLYEYLPYGVIGAVIP